MEVLLIICIVAFAAAYLVYRTWKSVKKAGTGCGCDCSCSGKEQNCMTDKNIRT